jgi:hypothetical protein
VHDCPDIAIAGFPNAGAAALAGLLAAHPEIAPIEPKEPHRYSWGLEPGLPSACRSTALTADAYREAIRAARARGRLVVDASRSYCHPAVIEGTASRLAQDCPDLRVILTVRDPIERLVADWRRRVAEGSADRRLLHEVRRHLDALKLSFGVREDSDLLAACPGSRVWLGLDQPSGRGPITVVASGFYDPLVAVYRERFGDRLLVVPAEALRSQPRAVLARCFAHVGVQPVKSSATPNDVDLSEGQSETVASRLARRLGFSRLASRLSSDGLAIGADELAGTPEHALTSALYERMACETRALVEREFGIRWIVARA